MLGILIDGGSMMIPLLICSIAAIAIIIDRARAFRAANVDFAGLRATVRECLAKGDVESAMDACEKSSGPVAATMLTGLQRYQRMKARGGHQDNGGLRAKGHPWS